MLHSVLIYNITFYYRGQDSEVNSKETFIQTVDDIVNVSEEVVKIATNVAEHCTDYTTEKCELQRVL